MKKVFVTIILVSMILTSCVAYGEIDLKQYNNEELISLLSAVQQEIVNRNIEKTANLPAGTYTIGKEIPAGTYTLYCKYDGSLWAYITITGEKGDAKFEGYVWSSSNPVSGGNGENSWHITLQNGDILQCSDPVKLTISAGIRFN